MQSRQQIVDKPDRDKPESILLNIIANQPT